MRGQKKAVSKGFTIVELLIVVVVIAILAAITIVAYNGIQNRAKSSATQTAVQQATKKVVAYATLNAEQYPGSLGIAGISTAGGTTYQYRYNNATTPRTFCVTATTGTISYFASNTQTTPTLGVCPGHAPNGGSPITNMATNPSAEVDNSNYTTFGGAVVTSSTDWASSGARSFRATTSSTTDAGDFRFAGGGLNSFALGMEPGKTYTVSARVNIPVAFTGALSRAPGVLLWVSTNGGTYTTNFGPKVGPAAGTYTTTHTFTLPSDATGAELGFGLASTTANQVVYYDSIILTEGATAYPFADGNTSGWAWNGAVNASTSSGPAL